MSHDAHRYQRWTGRDRETSSVGGLTAIVLTATRLQYNRPYMQALLLVGPILVIGICVILYVMTLLETLAGLPEAQGIYGFARVALGVDLSAVSRIGELREVLWRTVFAFAIRIELFAAMIIIARVGPGLIANDIKTNALPIYFARPVTPLTYLLGKWVTVAVFIGAVTMLPNLVSLAVGTMITGGLPEIGQTLVLGVDIVVAGIGAMLFGGLVMLALSSMTSDSRYVTVGWLAVCLLPAVAQTIIRENLDEIHTQGWLGSISLRDNFVALTERLFDLRGAWEATSLPEQTYARALGHPVDALYPAVVMAVITLAAATYGYRRVLKFSRSAANA